MRMNIAATLTGEGSAKREILIRDISRRGIGALSRHEAPRIGARVKIRIDGFAEITGTVRWVADDRFGLLLDQDLDPGIFDFPEEKRPEEAPRPGIDIFGD